MSLELENLSKVYRGKRVVDGVSLAIPQGGFVGIVGPSGAGKSTLLRLISRMEDPASGRILCDGRDITHLQGRALRLWRRRCAIIVQQFHVIGSLNVLSNVLLGRLGHGHSWRNLFKLWTEADSRRGFAALERLEIADLAAQRADRLSGGQQQRVAIARALVQEPTIILADEPVASLDPRAAHVVLEALHRINREFGITVLINIHAPELARHYCDRLIGLSQGRVLFDAPPNALSRDRVRQLYAKPAEMAA